MSLEEFDKTVDEQDEYETPIRIAQDLCKKYNMNPDLDVCADESNTKCDDYFTKEDNALLKSWLRDVWCNPPHSLTLEFVEKAQSQYMRYNINIIMIVPANAIGAHFFDYPFDSGSATYHRYSGRIKFLQHGRPAPNSSRNGYFVVLWRKK